MNVKGLFQSKTFWVAFVWMLFSGANYFGYGFEYPDAEGVVNQDWSHLSNAIFGAVMIVLRVITQKPISGWFRKKQPVYTGIREPGTAARAKPPTRPSL